MKCFHVITNVHKDKDFIISKRIKNYLNLRGSECHYEGEMKESTDCIIVLGGDGTLLQAARANIEKDIPLIGVNLGTLGYLAEVECRNLEDALDCLLTDHYEIEERMMIVGKVVNDGRVAQEMYALNDIVVARDGETQIIYFHIYVNGQLLNSYYADGVILSTPTGSTGYNMSAGGPIVEPKANLIVVTPICPHTIYSRSIILSPEDRIQIEIAHGKSHRKQYARVNFDGEYATLLRDGSLVEIMRSERKAKIIKIDQVSFLSTLQKKMSE
ncbi:MAG: NAD(+)/NADH kinase [Eubacteriales bacterium]